MAYVAVGVAVAALLFTVGSFWWLYARKGSITATRPRAYAFAGQHKLRLRFPFAFVNDGAKALVVVDLRLVLDDEPGQPELRWKTTRDRLRPEPEDGFAFPVPFTVMGRSSREVIAEFGPEGDLDWSPPVGVSQRLRLQGQVHPESGWIDFATFDWFPPRDDTRGAYIAHRNEPSQ
jgi:hypothetical protein